MTWYLEHTGHKRLGDGSILRLDAELGKYVASWYTPALALRACAFGGFEQMQEMLHSWIDAFEASLTSQVGGTRGEGSGQVQPIPCPEPPKLLGNTTFKETA